MTPRTLRDELFQLPSPDDQLLLAVALCLTEFQHEAFARQDRVIGISSEDLWWWLRARTANRDGHPNIDHTWKSLAAVRAALRRLEKKHLLRETRSEGEGTSAMLWRTTEATGGYLAEHRLFADEQP